MPEPASPARHLPNVAPPIIPATDLGGVTVLKRGLLPRPSRARIASCLYVGHRTVVPVLPVGGGRQRAPGGADRRTIVLTNPEAMAARFPAATRHVS